MKKLVATLALAGLGVFGTVVMTTPAHADDANCRRYLNAAGYSVGPKLTDLCFKAYVSTGSVEYTAIVLSMIQLGVSKPHAQEACRRAKL